MDRDGPYLNEPEDGRARFKWIGKTMGSGQAGRPRIICCPNGRPNPATKITRGRRFAEARRHPHRGVSEGSLWGLFRPVLAALSRAFYVDRLDVHELGGFRTPRIRDRSPNA